MAQPTLRVWSRREEVRAHCGMANCYRIRSSRSALEHRGWLFGCFAQLRGFDVFSAPTIGRFHIEQRLGRACRGVTAMARSTAFPAMGRARVTPPPPPRHGAAINSSKQIGPSSRSSSHEHISAVPPIPSPPPVSRAQPAPDASLGGVIQRRANLAGHEPQGRPHQPRSRSRPYSRRVSSSEFSRSSTP